LKNKIPKIIHYCWFGGNPEPLLMKQCIESWEKYLPDYELMLWNEKNFDIVSNIFVKEAYKAKKWAFVSDYVRMFVLYHYGGIYMDTDVEVLKNLDTFLVHDAFTGFENETLVPTGIIASKQGHPWIHELLNYYTDLSFINVDGSLKTEPNTAIITRITKEKYAFIANNSFQILKDGLVIYPKDYFCPKNYYDDKIRLTENTHTIHHFSGSWHTQYDQWKLKIHKIFISLFGSRFHDYLLKAKHSKL